DPALVNYNYKRSESDLNLDYIDINVINKFHLGKVNLQVGPGLAIATNSSNKNITPIDLTFNFGVGIDITRRLGVEARWMPGVVSINNGADTYHNGVQYIYDDYMRNNTFQIGAYLKF
ncbi:MAG: PorT family protein, partial [Flavobacterium sp.]